MAVLESLVLLATVAVLESGPPGGTAAPTRTTSVKVALAPDDSVSILAVKVPAPPAGGWVSVNVGPDVCDAETKVVPRGRTSLSETF